MNVEMSKEDYNAHTLFLFNAVIDKPEYNEPFELVNEAPEGDALTRRLENIDIGSNIAKKRHALAVEYGVVVDQSALHALDYIDSYMHRNRTSLKDAVSATFYTQWNDIVSRTDLELFLDKITHWQHQNEPEHPLHRPKQPEAVDSELISPELVKTLILVTSISKETALENSLKILRSKRALSEHTLEHAISLLDYLDVDWTAIFDTIKNKEARVRIFSKVDMESLEPHNFVRFLVFRHTDSSLLIKDKKTITEIVSSKGDISAECLEYSLIELSKVYNRFKPIFLAFKHANRTANASIINKIAKFSKLHHLPLPENPLMHSTEKKLNVSSEYLMRASTSMLIRALNACKFGSTSQEVFQYVIRNGTVWTKNGRRSATSIEASKYNFRILRQAVLDKFKANGFNFNKKYYIPTGIEYGLPASEKDLFGFIPMGTKITKYKEDLVVGATWKKDYKVEVLDLSTLRGNEKIGWDGKVQIEGILHSGDLMQFNKNGLATELIRYRELSSPEYESNWLLYANNWQGDMPHYFDILIGKHLPESDEKTEKTSDDSRDCDKSEQTDEEGEGSMLDLSTIEIAAYKYECCKRQCLIGLVQRKVGKTVLYISPRCDSNDKTVGERGEVIIEQTEQAILHKMEHSLSLNELLIDVLGCKLVENPEDADVDLSPEHLIATSFSPFMEIN